MSQKRRDFQSKPRFGGQKFGAKGRSRDEGRKGGFRKRFEGDKAEFGEKRERRTGGDRPQKRRFDDRPPRRDRFDGDRPQRQSFDDRPPRRGRFDGDRPQRRNFDDRPPRGDRFGGSDSRGGFKKRRFDRDDRGGGFGRDRDGEKPRFRKDFGDKKPRSEGTERGEFKRKPRFNREDNDRDFKKGGFKKDGFKKGGFKKEFGKDRPQRAYTRYEDDRPQRPFRKEAAGTETLKKLKSDRPSYGAPSSAFLYGIHPVTEALLNPKRIHQRLLCTENGFETIQAVYHDAQQKELHMPEVIYVENEDIERLLPRDAVHQGLLLDCQPLEEVFLSDVLVAAADDAKVIVLDQVTDPHNIGAIMRSAAAFGATAVVLQKVHAPDITGTLAKSASGAVEHVPLIREVNLSRALEQLKEAGFFSYGLDERGKRTLAETSPKGKVALVMGAEGEGLRRLVAENCDELVKLPTQGRIASLNVSNATAIALYELAR